MIASYLGARVGKTEGEADLFPRTFNTQLNKAQDLRYGENPHQSAAFYVEANAKEASVSTAKSYKAKNCLITTLQIQMLHLNVKSFAKPACVIVKHANPCGVAVSLDGIKAAYDLAYATDPESAFGGIIAFNRELDVATAQL